MATYKVLQDIEAEDKFVGPLTLKQFILACVCLVSGYLSFFFLTKNLWFLTIPLVPVMLVSGFLAFPWGRDQPTEVWLLAKVRFMLKPRRRIWDQTGMRELVTITAPKKVEQQFLGDDLSQTEVKSRLKALANTIDSRGWAIKNVNINLYAQPGYGGTSAQSDRLVQASALAPTTMPAVDIQAADDMMDERHNPTAQNLNQMIQASSQAHRQETLQQLQEVREHKQSAPKQTSHTNKNDEERLPTDYWFMKQPQTGKATTAPAGNVKETANPIEPAAASNKPSQPTTNDHSKTAGATHSKHKTHAKHPGSHSSKSAKSKNAHTDASDLKRAMTQTPDPAILSLANNDDLSVATIARQANKKPGLDSTDGEVVIPLR